MKRCFMCSESKLTSATGESNFRFGDRCIIKQHSWNQAPLVRLSNICSKEDLVWVRDLRDSEFHDVVDDCSGHCPIEIRCNFRFGQQATQTVNYEHDCGLGKERLGGILLTRSKAWFCVSSVFSWIVMEVEGRCYRVTFRTVNGEPYIDTGYGRRWRWSKTTGQVLSPEVRVRIGFWKKTNYMAL